MFQRKNRRQAGFIRTVNQEIDLSSRKIQKMQKMMLREPSCQFSPYKEDFSFEPSQILLQTQRYPPRQQGSTLNSFRQPTQNSFSWTKSEIYPKHHQLPTHKNKPENIAQIKSKKPKTKKLVKIHQQIPDWSQNILFRKTRSYENQNHSYQNRYKQNYEEYRDYQKMKIDTQNAESPTIYEEKMTTQDEEIYHIEKAAPVMEKEVPIMTLAQAFQSKCKKMKERLAYERQKFSKSLKKQYVREQSPIKSREEQEIIPFKPIKFDIPLPSKRTQKKQIRHTHTAEDNKQNNGDILNKKPHSRSRQSVHKNRDTINFETKTNFSRNETQISKQANTFETKMNKTAAAFFIPAPTSRSKPITKKQAYDHSFKKWKQLPQVVAKQKQKQKQQDLRERLCRVRAHSLEVRKKLKR